VSGANAGSGEAPAPPRTVLVTGTGGGGRSTVAAATARAAADGRRRVLLLAEGSGDAARFLLGTAPAPGAPGRAVPVPAVPGLWVAGTGPDDDFRARVAAAQDSGRAALDFAGAAALLEDELTAPPGAGAVALLGALRAAHRAEPAWDVVVVDMPPAEAALRVLALPGQARRWLRRLLPPEKQAARALRPVLAQLAGVPMPTGRLYRTAERWDAELAAVRGVLTAPGLSVRLVAEPLEGVADPLRTARGALALFGVPLESVVAARVLPYAGDTPWPAALREEQAGVLAGLRELCGDGGVRLAEVPHLGRTPRGARDLAVLADAVGPPVPAGEVPVPAAPVVEDGPGDAGRLVWRLELPGARKETLGLVRSGDDLIVGVGPHRRVLPLPPVLRRCRVEGAGLEAGVLRVRWVPDEDLWPAAREQAD
jgi:arsenite-transporting ATPase